MGSTTRLKAVLNRLAPGDGLIRASAILFVGGSLARAVGFLFSVATARLLAPEEFGLLAYGLTIANLASILIANAPGGLAAFLARYHGDRRTQELHYSNFLAVITLLIAISVVLMIPVAAVARLGPPMLAAIVANLIGFAVLQTYREAARGLERFAAMTIFYLLANIAQLIAVLIVAAFGLRSAAIFLTIYGLSSLVGLAIVQPIAPLAIKFVRRTVDPERMMAIARFIQPLILQTIFFAIWFGADLVVVKWLMPAVDAGNYAAAKALANAVYLGSNAISGVIVSRVARMPGISLPAFLLRVMALGAVATAPLLSIFIAFGNPLSTLVYGARYTAVGPPLAILSVGMAFYGLYLLLSGSWRALGRPAIDAWATGAGTIVTVALALLLVPRLGLVGAASAFTIGALTQLAVIGGYTVSALSTGLTSRLDQLMPGGVVSNG
jgi:O-antigen/teichoic acid export membrane protein